MLYTLDIYNFYYPLYLNKAEKIKIKNNILGSISR